MRLANKQSFCCYTDHDDIQEEVPVSTVDTDPMMRRLNQKNTPRVYFPILLHVESSLPDDERESTLDSLRQCKIKSNKRYSEWQADELQEKRRRRIEEMEASRQLFDALSQDSTQMSPRQWIAMNPVPHGERDFGVIKENKGVYLCAISPVHPDKFQSSSDGKETYKPNAVFIRPTTAMIPHLPNDTHVNTNKRVWFGVGFTRTKLFFFDHYRQFYTPNQNPLDDKGW